jgi:hypothetical protein
MDADRTRQTVMWQTAEQMREAARAATARAATQGAAAAATCLTAQQMRSDNQRMLATARAALQKITDVS